MELFSYIYKELNDLNILNDKEVLLIPLSTHTDTGNKMEFYVYTNDNNDFALTSYTYIYSAFIHNYGIDLNEQFNGSIKVLSNYDDIPHNEIYLEQDVNSGFICEPQIQINNDIKYLSTTLGFIGTYTGEYVDVSVVDLFGRFYIILDIQGIKHDNLYFNEYRNSLAKLLECIEYLSEELLETSFNSAYTALELLIKQVKSINYLTPSQTKSILINDGFNKDKAKTIIKDRNDKIHPSEYGFFDDEEDLKISLEHTLEAYFYFFNKYCN